MSAILRKKDIFHTLLPPGLIAYSAVHVFLILLLIRATFGFIVMQITRKRLAVSSDSPKIISTTD